MKVFIPNKCILNLILLLLSFDFILNESPCVFKKTKDGAIVYTDDEQYLNGITDEKEKKQMCFSLSHSDSQDEKCCYKNNECIKYVDETDADCPVETQIYNNCGMAGIYQPLTKEICTEISLVQGYCCFVKTKTKGTACIRTKELNKEKNTVTDQMKKYINDNGVNANEIESVECKGDYFKFYWLLIIFAVIFI